MHCQEATVRPQELISTQEPHWVPGDGLLVLPEGGVNTPEFGTDEFSAGIIAGWVTLCET